MVSWCSSSSAAFNDELVVYSKGDERILRIPIKLKRMLKCLRIFRDISPSAAACLLLFAHWMKVLQLNNYVHTLLIHCTGDASIIKKCPASCDAGFSSAGVLGFTLLNIGLAETVIWTVSQGKGNRG